MVTITAEIHRETRKKRREKGRETFFFFISQNKTMKST
jgi:hypothetical protein